MSLDYDDEYLAAEDLKSAKRDFAMLVEGLPFESVEGAVDIEWAVDCCESPSDLRELRRRVCVIIDGFEEIVENVLAGIRTIGIAEDEFNSKYLFSMSAFMQHAQEVQELGPPLNLGGFFQHLCDEHGVEHVEGDQYRLTIDKDLDDTPLAPVDPLPEV